MPQYNTALHCLTLGQAPSRKHAAAHFLHALTRRKLLRVGDVIPAAQVATLAETRIQAFMALSPAMGKRVSPERFLRESMPEPIGLGSQDRGECSGADFWLKTL